jgi:DNA modification methylase
MTVIIRHGDCREVLRTLPDQSVHCCVTSPPYWGLRDYGVDGQIGLEMTPEAFVAEMVAVFREVRRVLRDDGTLWLNLGDSYMGGGRGGGAENCKQRTNVGSLDAAPNQRVAGYKQKDLVGVPWQVAFALRADGWYLRQDIIWSKPNPMPESIGDRCTKAHEYVFLLSKSARYFYDANAIKEPASYDPANTKFPDGWDTGPGGHGSFHRNGREKGRASANIEAARPPGTAPQTGLGRASGNKSHKYVTEFEESGSEEHRTKAGLMKVAETAYASRNKRSVWTVATAPFSEAHFATFPPALIEPCILAGCPQGGTVLDPFGGAGTTGLVSDRMGRNAILIELNPEYAAIAERRLRGDAGMFAEVSTLSQAERS